MRVHPQPAAVRQSPCLAGASGVAPVTNVGVAQSSILGARIYAAVVFRIFSRPCNFLVQNSTYTLR